MVDNDGVSGSIPASRLRWDVFLSFGGEADTLNDFTDLLSTELEKNSVRVFRYNDGLTHGEEIAPAVLDAIADSAVSITVISPNYGSSWWCLELLAEVCAFRRLILPVFYGVDPSNVRRQEGPFKDDFRNLEERFGEEKVVRWRDAMEKAGGISGLVLQRSKEPQLIRSLVKRVLKELSNTPEDVAPYTVGLDFRLEELMSLLDVKLNGIKVLGLHGMGGVGKTTLAKALYNKLVGHFDCRCFISNVRETSAKQNGLVSQQNKLIGELSQGNAQPVDDDNAGKIAIKKKLHEKRVLLVLDDVDNVTQLNALAGRREWFCEGSRIIISTRDRNVLLAHLVNEIYEVKELGSSDSLKLFSYHALRREKPTETFLNLSQKIVSLTGGLPLALEVFGSSLLHNRKVEEWEDALRKLKQIRPHNLQDVLMISFDALDVEVKCVFLDIACLFLNLEMKKDDVFDAVRGCGFRAKIVITALIEKSLLKVDVDNSLRMHDQIRDMGRQIVLHEKLVDPGMRSRLWDRSEILHVLQERGQVLLKGSLQTLKKRTSQGIRVLKQLHGTNFKEHPISPLH